MNEEKTFGIPIESNLKFCDPFFCPKFHSVIITITNFVKFESENNILYRINRSINTIKITL